MITYPAVDDLAEEATSTLLGVCTQLSQSRRVGLAGWAASVSDALLVQLVNVTAGVAVDVTDIEPPYPLARLETVELEALHSLLRAGAEASDDDSVVEWCTRMVGLIAADFYRRAYEQAAIDAKLTVINAEEWRRACGVWRAPDLCSVRPLSGALRPHD
jgi:hypothetical protein